MSRLISLGRVSVETKGVGSFFAQVPGVTEADDLSFCTTENIGQGTDPTCISETSVGSFWVQVPGVTTADDLAQCTTEDIGQGEDPTCVAETGL